MRSCSCCLCSVLRPRRSWPSRLPRKVGKIGAPMTTDVYHRLLGAVRFVT
jgi:hypothetical protein